jgi:hypothetical protein
MGKEERKTLVLERRKLIKRLEHLNEVSFESDILMCEPTPKTRRKPIP